MFEISQVKKDLLMKAEKEMMELRHPYVGTEHLLLALLKNDEVISVMSPFGVSYEIFKNTLVNIVGKSSKKSEVVLYTPLLRIIISKSKDDVLNILYTLLISDDGIALRILEIMGVNIDEIISDISEIEKNNDFDVISSKEKLIGRVDEINKIIEILLRKNKNNPLLLGNAGVGKSAIVYELSRRIEENLVPDKLKGYKIINIDLSSILANTKYRGEFETKLNNLIKSVKHKKIILFIDEIHTLTKCGGGESSIDAANILKPYLANSEISLIGATTTTEYENTIAVDKALQRRFAIINIEEPNSLETKTILKGLRGDFEEYHGYKISNQIIDKIVEYSDIYMKDRSNPDKSIEIMDVLMTHAKLKSDELSYLSEHNYKAALNLRKITINDLDNVIESLTGIHIIKKEEIASLKHDLKDLIECNNFDKIIESKYMNIVGYDKLTLNVVNIIKDKLNYKLLNIDGSEYTNETSINRLIGSDPGYVGYNDFNILNTIKYNPYTLIYLSNYDNFSENIKLLFSSIIEKKYYKDNKNNIINFNNTLIIMGHNKNTLSIGFNNTCKEEFINQVNLKIKNDIMI